MKKCDLCGCEFENAYLECNGIKICDKCGEFIEEESKESCHSDCCTNQSKMNPRGETMSEGEKSYLNFVLQTALAELESNEPELAAERLVKYVDYYKKEVHK